MTLQDCFILRTECLPSLMSLMSESCYNDIRGFCAPSTINAARRDVNTYGRLTNIVERGYHVSYA